MFGSVRDLVVHDVVVDEDGGRVSTRPDAIEQSSESNEINVRLLIRFQYKVVPKKKEIQYKVVPKTEKIQYKVAPKIKKIQYYLK